MERLEFTPDFAGWQNAARGALRRELPPSSVVWCPLGVAQEAELELFGDNTVAPALELKLATSVAPAPPAAVRVPRKFLERAKWVACHSDAERWDHLYRLLWRLTHGEPHLLELLTDPEVIAFGHRVKAVEKDVHKMRAFVRFREVPESDDARFVAWFEPHHHIVELNAGFFVDRFATMKWSILTPDRCAHWDRRELTFSAGIPDRPASEDAVEDLWRTYYRSIFNPARVKVQAMKREMAPYYWDNLPESVLIPELIAQAPVQTAAMVAASRSKAPAPEIFTPAPVPATNDLNQVRAAADLCRACPLWRNATCTVFGEGPAQVRVVLVGEQPGDQEDRAGRPFVGPAGQLLNRALDAAGVDRSTTYVTNAVKHFKWEPRGKRRLHQKPNSREIAACRPWLEKEIQLLKPSLIVCLGATAAHSILGSGIKVSEDRGRTHSTEFGMPALVTVHPSALLRQPDPSKADADFAAFVNDLREIGRLIGG